MTLTNLSQITTSGISTLADINLNNLTGVAATFTGNVTVGGTLTYDDVTNIDSVGLVTARSGVEITSGDLIIPDTVVHRGDTNTKIRFPADDTVTVETAGAERVRVTSDGDVGIAITNPKSLLHVYKGSSGNTSYAVGDGIIAESDDNVSLFLQSPNDKFGAIQWGDTDNHLSISGFSMIILLMRCYSKLMEIMKNFV